MRRKIFFVITILAIAAMCLAACSVHEHTFYEEWNSDAVYHWHDPVCDDIKPIKEKHSFDENGICTVCDYGRTSSGDTGKGTKPTTPGAFDDTKPSGDTNKEETKPNEGSQGEKTPGDTNKDDTGKEETTPGEGNRDEETPGDTNQDASEPNEGALPGEVEFDYRTQIPDDTTITGVPDSEGNVTYRIRVNRYNGRRIGYPLPFVKVVDANDESKVVYDDYVPLWKGANFNETELSMIDLKLPEGKYKVTPYNIPEGFEIEDNYTMDAENPVLDIKLTSHLRQGELKEIKEGTVLNDFEIKSVNGKGTTTLSELLKTNQIVMLSFFYGGCYWCHEECPVLMDAYRRNKGKITYVFIDTVDTEEQTLQVAKSWFGDLADDFYVVCDKNNEERLYQKVVWEKSRPGVPCNIFVDNGGYIFKQTGGLTEIWLNRIIELNAFAMPALKK